MIILMRDDSDLTFDVCLLLCDRFTILACRGCHHDFIRSLPLFYNKSLFLLVIEFSELNSAFDRGINLILFLP